MIIKNLRWKRFCPRRLINYINDPEKVHDKEPIYWNVSEHSTDGVYQDLQKNDTFLNIRKNSNRLLHDIISFSPEDNKYLTETKVRTLAYEYLKSRATKNIAYGRIHRDREHWHVHFAISPNEIYQSKVTHFNRKEYLRIRNDLEQYQSKHFPELEHSIVFLNEKRKERSQKSEKEIQYEKRTQRTSKKEQIRQEVQSCFERSYSLDEFVDTLLQAGYETYTYRGKINGVIKDQKKYRFTTLGISKMMLVSLNKKENREIQQRMKELEQLQKRSLSKSQSRWK